MTRTERSNAGSNKPSKNVNTAAARQSQISRSLSKLLRHQAENEKIPISAAGWVRMDDLLAWRGLDRVAKGVTLAEIFEVVEEDGRTGKGRFGVKYVDDQPDVSTAESQTTSTDTDDSNTPQNDTTSNSQQKTSKNTAETQSALHHHFLHPTTPPSSYLIRATQGHSMTTINSTTEIFSPLTLTSANFPTTVVHGTFYGSWPLILRSGGLKSMGRTHVHFATGPGLDEVLALTDSDVAGAGLKGKSQVDEVLSKNKVISGMRWDAQLLIYVDLKRCLEDVAVKGSDMSWWVSGNGVVLTEGLIEAEVETEVDGEQAAVMSKVVKARKERENLGVRVVPMRYWSVVVEIKNGLGVIWRQSEGVVKELPERLRNMPLPRGKGRVHGGRGGRGGGKPRLNVERGGGSSAAVEGLDEE